MFATISSEGVITLVDQKVKQFFNAVMEASLAGKVDWQYEQGEMKTIVTDVVDGAEYSQPIVANYKRYRFLLVTYVENNQQVTAFLITEGARDWLYGWNTLTPEERELVKPLDEVARRVASGAERAMNEFIADFKETFHV